jgi:hypothetical protein
MDIHLGVLAEEISLLILEDIEYMYLQVLELFQLQEVKLASFLWSVVGLLPGIEENLEMELLTDQVVVVQVVGLIHLFL